MESSSHPHRARRAIVGLVLASATTTAALATAGTASAAPAPQTHTISVELPRWLTQPCDRLEWVLYPGLCVLFELYNR